MTNLIQDVADDITLLATLHRIKRKADIMALDWARGTLVAQNSVELQLLAGIALRCIGIDSEARQDSHEEKLKHMAVTERDVMLRVVTDNHVALQRAEAAEAKLAKAIAALDEAIYLLHPDEEDMAKEAGVYRIVTTHKELKEN
jgi:hypothetical protein